MAIKHNTGSSRLSNGSITNDPSLKADVLSQYSDSVYNVDNDDFPNTGSDLSSISFNATIISRCLDQLIVRAVGGPDNDSPVFLDKCCNCRAYPIAFILQLFVDNSLPPDVWRQAYISPVVQKVV